MKNKCPIYEVPTERPPKRLTYNKGISKGVIGFDEDFCYEICDEFSSNCDLCPVQKVILKLVDYEDLFDNPEKVKKLIEKNKELQKENKKLKAEMMQYAWYNRSPIVVTNNEFLNTDDSEKLQKILERAKKFNVIDNTKE